MISRKINLREVLFSILIVILPNLFFWYLCHNLGLHRVFINIDYFIPIAFLYWNKKFTFFILYIFVFYRFFTYLWANISYYKSI